MNTGPKESVKITKMADNSSNTKMIQIIFTIFTSAFALTILYDICNQKGIWIAYLLVLYGLLAGLQSFIDKHWFTRYQTKDVDKVIIDQIFIILYLTIMFVLTKVAMDIVSFLVAINEMKWYDYINIALPVLLFMMAIVTQLEF